MSKLGLALGGGGARGFAHIGVLKALEKEGIEISAITGCSMGAIIGGLYAYYGNAKKVEEHVFNSIESDTFQNLPMDELVEEKPATTKGFYDQFLSYIGFRFQVLKSLNRIAFFSEEKTEEIFSKLPDVNVEDLKIKFSAIATDLLSGNEINFTKGKLGQVLRASSAIPGVFPPVKIDDYYLVDGSASESVPAKSVKEIGADRTLAIDVTRCIKSIEPPNNIIDVLTRAEDITSFHLSKERLIFADLVIRPEVRHLSWAEFDKAEFIIQKGEEATLKNISAIKKLAQRNSYLLEMEQYIKKLKN